MFNVRVCLSGGLLGAAFNYVNHKLTVFRNRWVGVGFISGKLDNFLALTDCISPMLPAFVCYFNVICCHIPRFFIWLTWFIWYNSHWLDWNNNQYNTVKSMQYYTRPRLIVMSQAIGYKRIPKFISSGWDVFKSLSVAQTVCHWRVSFFRQQIVQDK